MSSEASSNMGSSYPDSVSFPNTRMQTTKPFPMGLKVFRFQPVRSEVLIKQLLEDDDDSPKPDKSQNKPKTSHIMSHRGKYANTDSGSSSSSDDDSNILDKTITEDDSIVNNKDLIPGVSWLDSPPNRKPLKIIAKPVPSTPMTNMFNKLSLRDQSSVKKEPRSVSLDRDYEEKLKQSVAVNNNLFKTPSCKTENRINPSSSSAQNHPSERSAIPSINNHVLSSKKRQLEITTPKQQRVTTQTNKMYETPRQTSIIQAAIHKNFDTPRTGLPSATKDKIISSSTKHSDVILREKNMNMFQRQRSKELIVSEEKVHPNKQNSIEMKQLPNKNEIKTPINKQMNFHEHKQPNKQTNHVDVKQSSSNEFKHSNNNESNKQTNSNEFKNSNNNDSNKQSNSNELKPQSKQQNVDKQLPNKVQVSVPTKSLQESTFQQLKVRGKDYIVINKIGEGGSGQVYRCLEQETLQDRAIKVVNLNVNAATVTSYVNEVKMLKELQGNDRVIRMYDYEHVNQNLFVVMEKGDIDFSVFLRNITNEPQIQTHVIVCYWIEMLKCVREIHKKGIIHSDLKPSNFLIVDGRLKLIDFGIASRLTADMTSVIKNVTVGTLNYISPEALLDSKDCTTDEKPQIRISYKSDVWSLGCILYQMVYKRTPFHTVGNMWAKFAVITDRNHKINYQDIPGVPLFLIEMIKKCLVYDMRSRPTVEELLNMYYSGSYY